uniref:Uncharacterized protein n=1 Tax=Fagus sylvatica TaxID=28930 RepID=A0A2N9HR54_FAGSY
MVAWVSFGFLVSSDGPTSHGQANHSGHVVVMMAMSRSRTHTCILELRQACKAVIEEPPY